MKFNLLTDATENEVTIYLARGCDESIHLWAINDRDGSHFLLMTFNEDGSASLVADCTGTLRSFGFAVESVDNIDKLRINK